MSSHSSPYAGICDFGCAATAGVIGRTSAFPMDTIKTVSSVTHGASVKPDIMTAVRTIHASDGCLGFYRGLGISCVASAPGVALYISSYEHAKDYLKGLQEGEGKRHHIPDPALHVAAGLFAEAVSCIIWVPMDVVKERLQSQHSGVEGRYRSSWHGLSTLFRLEGIRGMYKGYFSTLGSFGPFSAVYFMAFEEAKDYLDSRKRHSGSQWRVLDKTDEITATETALAAAAANVTACVVVNPLEVCKTRYQVHRAILETKGGVVQPTTQFRDSMNWGSMLSALRWSLRNEGLTELWTRGLLARICFQTPSAAITFGCYSMMHKRWCSHLASSEAA